MKSTRMSLLAAIAMSAAAMTGALTEGPKAGPPSVQSESRKRRRQLSGQGSDVFRQRRRGPGWTNAHVKRMAKKTKNRARNKAAHR